MGHYDECYEEERRKICKGLRDIAKKDLKDALKSFSKTADAQDMQDVALILEEWKHVKAFANLFRAIGRRS